jgi:flagellar hook-basal body complex protein FliE
MNSIQTTSVAAQTPLPVTSRETKTGDGGSFKDMLLKSIQDVNTMQQDANKAVETLMTGGDADPAAVMTAVQKADLAFRMLMQMRNKVLSVYQEVKDIRI